MLLSTRHRHAVRLLARDAMLRPHVMGYFRLRPRHGQSLASALECAGMGQADLVLCLLRCGYASARPMVERLMGHSITYGPPCLLYYRDNGAPRVRRWIQRVVSKAPDNPRVDHYARERFEAIRVGMTEEQLRLRGVGRREFTWLRKRGWIRTQEMEIH